MATKAIRTKWGIGETSGTTEFEDGTKAYWTEGRSSQIAYKFKDGRIETYDVNEDPTEYKEALDDNEFGEDGGYHNRADHNEWEAAHGNLEEMTEEEWVEYSGQEDEAE